MSHLLTQLVATTIWAVVILYALERLRARRKPVSLIVRREVLVSLVGAESNGVRGVVVDDTGGWLRLENAVWVDASAGETDAGSVLVPVEKVLLVQLVTATAPTPPA